MANDNKNNQADEKENNSEDKNRENNKKKTKLFRVKFLKSYTPYVKGDIAGLNTEEAKELIKVKICEKV